MAWIFSWGKRALQERASASQGQREGWGLPAWPSAGRWATGGPSEALGRSPAAPPGSCSQQTDCQQGLVPCGSLDPPLLSALSSCELSLHSWSPMSSRDDQVSAGFTFVDWLRWLREGSFSPVCRQGSRLVFGVAKLPNALLSFPWSTKYPKFCYG